MPDERMHDLTIRPLAGGGFELEQRAGGLDEPAVVHLHPAQVRLLAKRAGMSARHVGRLQALRERLDEIHRFYIDEIIDRCGSGIEFALHLRAVRDLVDEMLADVETEDGDGNAGSVTQALPAASNEKSAAISVTPPASNRGRPASGKALTNAERQTRHREKQAEAPRQDALPLRENVHA